MEKKLIDFETLCELTYERCDDIDVCKMRKDTCPIWNILPDAVSKWQLANDNEG